MTFEGEHFLHQKDSKLHTSEKVEYEQKRRERANEEKHHKPTEKIVDWMEILDRTHTGHRDDPRVAERIKDYYHKEHVIKREDIPESAFVLEQRIARNLGHGDVEIAEEFREQKREQIIGDQEQSLDQWIAYLTSPDADVYPTWAKYWAFTSVTAMGKYEKSEDEDGKETARFSKRTKDTVVAFPPLNAAAFAMTIGVIQEQVEQKNKPKGERSAPENISSKLSDEEFKKLLTSENFSKLYAQFLIEQPVYSSEGLKETRGEWVTYPKGSEPDELVQSLEGYPLEWCIRNSGTARDYLKGGDMHIYYSINEDGAPVVPRLAIRMQEDEIAEVRGIAGNQNLDPYISPVVEDKMKEFPDGEKYQKKSEDMRKVTDIEERVTRGEQLNKDDLRFLYQVDGKIQGFGYERDPRIEELIQDRDVKEDLSCALNISKDQISTTKDEALSGGILFHYGNLDLGSLTSAEGLTLPESIGGYLFLGSLTSAEGLTLPENIGGSLYLNILTSAEGLTLPESIGGYLFLGSLTSAEGLTLPENIGGSLYLNSLTSAERDDLRTRYPNLKIK